jgi:membrane protein
MSEDDARAVTRGRDARTRTPSRGGAVEDVLPKRPTAQDGPSKPTSLSKRSWLNVFKRTVRQVGRDRLTSWAAALTYYAILSIFPGLLVLIAALKLTGQQTTQKVLTNVESIAPGPARGVLAGAIKNLQQGQSSTAGVLAVVGLLGALWSASGYVGSFMQAANSIYDVPEGRPIWKKLPTRLAVTVVAGVIVGVAALAVVFTGSLARQLGKLVGLGPTFVTIWDIAKWPVLIILISLLFALLYWAGPNAKHGGFRWITPGSLLAVLVWIVASAGFAFYIANFSSYNKTYGSLAAVIVFLVWLWLSNLAILFGAEFDAELQRGRAIEAGHSPDDEPYMDLRDSSKVDPAASTDL